MEGRLRDMASIYISKGNKMLLLYRQGGRVVNDVWAKDFEAAVDFYRELFERDVVRQNNDYDGIIIYFI